MLTTTRPSHSITSHRRQGKKCIVKVDQVIDRQVAKKVLVAEAHEFHFANQVRAAECGAFRGIGPPHSTPHPSPSLTHRVYLFPSGTHRHSRQELPTEAEADDAAPGKSVKKRERKKDPAEVDGFAAPATEAAAYLQETYFTSDGRVRFPLSAKTGGTPAKATASKGKMGKGKGGPSASSRTSSGTPSSSGAGSSSSAGGKKKTFGSAFQTKSSNNMFAINPRSGSAAVTPGVGGVDSSAAAAAAAAVDENGDFVPPWRRRQLDKGKDKAATGDDDSESGGESGAAAS